MLNGVETPIIGNITRDPELQFSPAGKAWVRFSVAVNRVTNRDGQRDTKATFVNCKAFGAAAENIAASLKQGTRVIAYGRFEEETWDKDGEKRRTWSFMVDEIGPSTRYAKITGIEKNERAEGGYNGGGYGGGQGSYGGGGYSGGNNGGYGGNQGGSQGGYGGGQGGGNGGYDSPGSSGGDDNPFF